MSKFAPYRWRYFWKNLPYIFWYEPKYVFQRFFRGWSDDQLWSLDCTLGEIILKYLKLFKASKRMGFPSGLDTNQLWAENMTDDQHDEAMQKWETVLDDMIYGLDYLTHYDEKDSELRNRMGIRFVEEYPSSDKRWNFRTEGPWDEYLKKSREQYEDAKKKSHLFIEYFNSLWD